MDIKKGITLIGMPGSGKSTIGKHLAKRLNFKFIDLDVLIKEKEGEGHDSIAKKRGEDELLRLEEAYTLGLDLERTVFSPGGSIVYSKKAMEKLAKETAIFYIELPLWELEKRLRGKLYNRGIIGIREKGLDGLFRERTPLYEGCANSILSCEGMSVDGTINCILDELTKFEK